MHDHVGFKSLEELVHQAAVGDGSLHDLEVRVIREVVSSAGRVVVDHEDVVATFEETVSEM
jgi:hypothetical protein